jgi:adenine C2-methylase RlmN of 23S rRNA A2503 and tRNA A37
VRKDDLPVYIRTPRGGDAAAACGQLAARSGPAGLFELGFTRQVS